MAFSSSFLKCALDALGTPKAPSVLFSTRVLWWTFTFHFHQNGQLLFGVISYSRVCLEPCASPPIALRLSSCLCSDFCFTPMIFEHTWDFTGVAHLLGWGWWLRMWPVMGTVAVTLRRLCASLLAEGEWSPPVCCSAVWSQYQQSSADISQCNCGFFIVLGSSLPDVFWLRFR